MITPEEQQRNRERLTRERNEQVLPQARRKPKPVARRPAGEPGKVLPLKKEDARDKSPTTDSVPSDPSAG